MKNFATRCIAALAGNGAILLSIGNYVANQTDSQILKAQAPFLGGICLVALIAVVCAYSALDTEESAPPAAIKRLRWSARLFFISVFGFAMAMITAVLE